jgi:hypothetical protein
MEKNEKDIVNKNITPETLRRQQDIMTRLLEPKRPSGNANWTRSAPVTRAATSHHADPARYFDYQRRKAREAELLRTVPPGLKPYYRDRVNEYFGTFDRP